MTEPANEPQPQPQPETAAAPETPADPLAELQARIAELEAETARTRESALRAMADAENMRKRAEREIVDREKYAVGNFAKALLAVADNLRRALDTVSAEARAADPHLMRLAEGVELTERELLSVFERNGVAKIDASGKPFDPALHQAVAQVDAPDKAPGSVVQVFQPGYTIHGRLLREAMVTVAKGAPAAGIDTTA